MPLTQPSAGRPASAGAAFGYVRVTTLDPETIYTGAESGDSAFAQLGRRPLAAPGVTPSKSNRILWQERWAAWSGWVILVSDEVAQPST